jgi:Putative zinc-binding metallo-peptidase
MTDAELLAIRMCDLPLTLHGSEVETRLDRLRTELQNAGLRMRPHAWLSDEWFVPDGVSGLAIPFYLAHPRLERLEKKEMLEAEGAGDRECMKILRHEAGHAVDNAYRLHFRREWQRLFGSFAAKYPNHYTPRANSRRFVLHLNNWYAQAHPAEDFAETFAVWLTPNSRWRQNYARWPALRKLEYVDRLMAELDGVAPSVRKRDEVRLLRSLKHTLGRHYERRKSHYLRVTVDFYSRDLMRLFAPRDQTRSRETACSVLRRLRPGLRETVAFWTGIDKYTVNQVIDGMIDRARDLDLRLTVSRSETERNLAILVTTIATNMIHSGRNRVAL